MAGALGLALAYLLVVSERAPSVRKLAYLAAAWLVGSIGCARADLTRNIDASLGVPFSIYRQAGTGAVSRQSIAAALDKDLLVKDELGAYDVWTGLGVTSLALGIVAGGFAIGSASNERADPNATLALGVTSLSLIGVGLISDLIARIELGSAIHMHNRQLSGFSGTIDSAALDPQLEVGPSEDEEEE